MPEPTLLEERPQHRASLVRRAALLTPMGIAATALLGIAILNLPSTIIVVVILGLSAVALDIEAISALRDLRAQPVTTEGRVGRVWKKSRFLLFGRVDYMLIDRALFEIGAVTAAELREGDEVVVRHWPHSHVVISVARKASAPSPSTTSPSSTSPSSTTSPSAPAPRREP